MAQFLTQRLADEKNVRFVAHRNIALQLLDRRDELVIGFLQLRVVRLEGKQCCFRRSTMGPL